MRVVEGRAHIEDLDDFLDSLGEVGQEHDCAVQAFNADYVVGEDHLQVAVEHADRAFDRGENVARERAVEILLYAAGRRQINRAFQLGVSEGDSDVVVVVHSPTGDAESEQQAATAVEDLIDPVKGNRADSNRIDREAVREFFDVSEAELDATDADVADLVYERVALLDVEK